MFRWKSEQSVPLLAGRESQQDQQQNLSMKTNLHRKLATAFTTQMTKALVLGLAVAGLLVVSGCGQSQESARKELAALKLTFTATDFFFSAMEGDKTAVALFLKAGMDVNTTLENGNGMTALMVAMSKTHLEIVKLLLSKKADPNLADADGTTPLVFACLLVGDLKVVTLLLDKGARIDMADKDGSTALIWAAGKHNPEIVSLLLKKGADVHVTRNDGATALDHALGDEGIKLLGLFGTKAFDAMAGKDQQETIQLLRKGGVRPISGYFIASVFKELDTLLPQRALNTEGAKDTREFLFNLFDNFKAIGFDGQQMTEARSRAVKTVARAKARIAMSSMTAQSAENKQVQQEFIELTKELMADPQVERLEASKQLLDVAAKGNMEAVKEALSNGANPNYKNESGFTPLLYAILKPHPELVPVLIQAKADVNLGGILGMTPLMMASALGDEASVKLLLDQGAKPAATNEKGQTALMIAKAQKQDAVVKLLEAAEARRTTAISPAMPGLKSLKALQRARSALPWAAGSSEMANSVQHKSTNRKKNSMEIVILLIVIGTSVWVYFDATKIGVKKTGEKAQAGKFHVDMGPVGWAVCSLLLWIVAFPAYLVMRPEFLTKFQPPRPPTPAPALNTTAQSPPDFDEQLRKLAKLKSEGLITDEEFNSKKKQLLGL